MVEALDQLEHDLESRLSAVAAQERFATSQVEKAGVTAELNKRLTQMVNLAASVAWPVKRLWQQTSWPHGLMKSMRVLNVVSVRPGDG